MNRKLRDESEQKSDDPQASNKFYAAHREIFPNLINDFLENIVYLCILIFNDFLVYLLMFIY